MKFRNKLTVVLFMYYEYLLRIGKYPVLKKKLNEDDFCKKIQFFNIIYKYLYRKSSNLFFCYTVYQNRKKKF